MIPSGLEVAGRMRMRLADRRERYRGSGGPWKVVGECGVNGDDGDSSASSNAACQEKASASLPVLSCIRIFGIASGGSRSFSAAE